ncbi:GH22957 [Drosophila grimshawi]|uniref:GH22957 n=1 Tax=Drosophila grimshawi TaxID=7222 RepID=B4JW22_DROGR|nr:GH22957 [Drosophila grimshawi]
MMDRESLSEWAKDKPLSILQLDPADRAVLRIADERDAIQKKTFTKWVNKHLKKANRRVVDLFEDLRDGHNLLSLLEVLSGEHLPREKGKMRFHMLQNAQMALDFLRYKKIKLVNIRAEDIVDGNPKLTLGLIWTIILHFQPEPEILSSHLNMADEPTRCFDSDSKIGQECYIFGEPNQLTGLPTYCYASSNHITRRLKNQIT